MYCRQHGYPTAPLISYKITGIKVLWGFGVPVSEVSTLMAQRPDLGHHVISSNQPTMTTTAENLGWNVDAVTDDKKITIVKKAVVYSEITMSKSEFIKWQNSFNGDWDEAHEYFRDNIESKMVTDDVMEDFGNQYNQFAVFNGDISSMTDDVIGMCDFEWENHIDNVSEIQEVAF